MEVVSYSQWGFGDHLLPLPEHRPMAEMAQASNPTDHSPKPPFCNNDAWWPPTPQDELRYSVKTRGIRFNYGAVSMWGLRL